MIACRYCGFEHDVFQSTCAACGAPLQAGQAAVAEKAGAQSSVEKIRRLCRQTVRMYRIGRFQDGDAIPEKKLLTIAKSFSSLPKGKEVYFYCDTSPLFNGKQGFMICEDGIYWQNSWFKPTKRNFLAWDRFREREIALKKYDLDLGGGDVISLSGIGRPVLFPIITGIFQRMQKILQENK